ncbi:MAG: SDR family NAD(P)-dependent oxidoreductase, partial [bacterium]|nr:SDR family NAD(P)-dependent oxidoreductase [bacterium]
PPYPFERTKYRLEETSLENIGGTAKKEEDTGKKDPADWFYMPSWKRSLPVPQKQEENNNASYCLVFAGDHHLGLQLMETLKASETPLIIVGKGSGFACTGPLEFTIAPGRAADYETLAGEISQLDKPVTRILHMWNLEETGNENISLTGETIDEAQELGFYSLLNLAKAMGKQEKGFGEKIRLDVLSDGIHDITGEEMLKTEKSTILAICKVIPQEYHSISCRSIDILAPQTGTHRFRRLVEQLAEELFSHDAETVVAYRGNNRWVQTYEPLHLELPGETSTAPVKYSLKEGGVYLITGGLGAIGLAVAKYLAEKYHAKLVLTGRSQFPPRQEWANRAADAAANDAVTQKIRKLMEISASETQIEIICADVARAEQMKNAIDKAEEKFGTLDGFIHAAGILPGNTFETIEVISREECRKQFGPKIYALPVLETLLQEKNLDFCILMSSVASILGGLGFAAYSAANTFMDAFVHRHNRESRTQWISVNWSDWLTAAETGTDIPKTSAMYQYGMTPEEGVNAFDRLFSAGRVNQVVHSTGDLQNRIDKWLKLETLRENNDGKNKETAAFMQPRPDLDTIYTPPTNPLEQTLTDIWQNLFGFEKLGIHDDFLELGGDSLKAITLLSRLHKELNREVPLAVFFKTPTVNELARYIQNAEETVYTTIEPAEEKEYYPLSSSQKGLYYMQQMAPESTSYHEANAVILEGEIDKNFLQTTFMKLIRRHESLRTSFDIVDHQPVQIIHKQKEIDFHIDSFDARDKPTEKIIKDFVAPFDLKHCPLFKIGLIRLQQLKHILIVEMHHIITDGVSNYIFMRDFLHLHENRQLPPLKLQYKDFSQWQNRLAQTGEIHRQKEYWRGRFK